ncbi:hypothetical protein EXIGLDRAFT_477692, partial [Exidia glandulosa HHB12029]
MARSRAVLAVFALGAATLCAADPITLRNTDSQYMSFAPAGTWSEVPVGSNGEQVKFCDHPEASIEISMPENSTSLQWYAIPGIGPSTYLVCINCSSEDDWARAFLVDALQRDVSNGSVSRSIPSFGSGLTRRCAQTVIWHHQAADATSPLRTVSIRNGVDPRYGKSGFLSMDALVVNSLP